MQNSVVEFYDTMPPMIPETYAGIIPTPKQCNFCRFWQADADGLFGVCLSDGFAAKVYAERDEGSPIKTAEDFECPYWERGYE